LEGELQQFEPATDVETAGVPFAFYELDNTAGDIKIVGDIDGDSQPDLVIGGSPDEPLSWYHYPDWQKYQIAVATNEFTTDGALGDVDGDGDLDVVVPDGTDGDNVLWFENPLPDGDPTVDTAWARHAIGGIGSWGKDIELADFDGNGRLDVATRIDTAAMIFFQIGPDEWEQSRFSDGVDTGHEGMISGDVNSDGWVDIVLHGVWLENPGGDAARTGANWNEYRIGTANPDFKALVVDLNQDGVMDVLFSSSENTADVDWWTPKDGDPTGTWEKHTIIAQLERAHTLQAADMDLDGDIDVVVGQMHTSADQKIRIFFNDGGDGLNWSEQIVGDGGLHDGVVADIGNDCDYDIYGANWTGNPPVRLWENQLNDSGPLDRWNYKEITDKHEQTFGLAFGDVDGDGRQDIISGLYWYHNPGDDLLGDWAQHDFPDGMHAFLSVDVDGDANADVIAQKTDGDLNLYWLEASDNGAGDWTAVQIGNVEQASHELGAQGYRTAQIEGDDRPEILISSGNGIYYFRIPDNPEAGNWPRVHVNGNPSDEGFAVIDMDGDGLADIAGTTGDSKRVEWYRNPGDGSDEWQAFPVGDFSEALFPDRTEAADLNGDGRPDIVVTDETGTDADAETFWWEQPGDPTSANWERHLVVTQGSTNSMDVGDVDGDGDMDLVLAEHRGSLRLAVWVNDGSGNFTEKVVGEGHESHLGGRLVDLDGDGDLDIVSIAWDAPNQVHLWVNDSTANSCQP
ncbi:MAG: VCBS repeat-containing protein, partial [Candidatus Promineifilaceae bacterium]